MLLKKGQWFNPAFSLAPEYSLVYWSRRLL